MKNLVIVESPNKVATIKKFLGEDFEVVACYGHITNLAKTGQDQLGIDIGNWVPDVELDKPKLKYFNKIQELAKKANKIWIATDADREGEAIGYDIITFLKAQDKYSRVKYKEITNLAILEAFNNPTFLNQALIDAQKARRMLDRILGFLLSKLMREKLTNVSTWNLSAGRVQSVALKLTVDREVKRQKFIPTLYSRIFCFLEPNIKAYYYNSNSDFSNKEHESREEAQKIFEQIENIKEVKIEKVLYSNTSFNQALPFKQSSIFKVSNYSAAATSMGLQKLYEGYGNGGLITYPRTDATWISKSFLAKAQSYVQKKTSKDYLVENVLGHDGDQDAHEAIRPTNITLTPQKAAKSFPLSKVELHLYTLIWQQVIKSIVKAPVFRQTRYEFLVKDYKFYFHQKNLIFNGYYEFIGFPETQKQFKDFKEDDIVKVKEFVKEDKETQPTPRYTEGSLIAKLDEIKVGRPSTFAHTVQRIKFRNYVELEEGYFVPTPIGFAVFEKLQQGFSEETSESYTAKVEAQLDAIAEGKVKFQTVLQEFWEHFSKALENAREKMTISTIHYQKVGVNCPWDKADLLFKYQKNVDGKFIACSNFPNCRFTASNIEDLEKPKTTFEISGLNCQLCSKDMLWRKGKKGNFLGCSGYPKCRFSASTVEDFHSKSLEITSEKSNLKKQSKTIKKPKILAKKSSVSK